MIQLIKEYYIANINQYCVISILSNQATSDTNKASMSTVNTLQKIECDCASADEHVLVNASSAIIPPVSCFLKILSNLQNQINKVPKNAFHELLQSSFEGICQESFKLISESLEIKKCSTTYVRQMDSIWNHYYTSIISGKLLCPKYMEYIVKILKIKTN